VRVHPGCSGNTCRGARPNSVVGTECNELDAHGANLSHPNGGWVKQKP
jgi:hypothetical protein